MGELRGFLKYPRVEFSKEPVESRKRHWKEFIRRLSDQDIRRQAARCMDCGIPFCHWACPLGNVIPDWNDLVYRDRWQEAVERLHETNNFPEITGRICPSLCEYSCVMAINKPATTIRNLELSIVEKAFEKGWIVPRPPKRRTGKSVAVVGSGPAGLACADVLNKLGHLVTVFEKNERAGGLLAIGIPDFKLEKRVIDRRLELLKDEGIVFKTGAHVGVDIKADYIKKEFDAIVLAGGAEQPRDLKVPGRELKGVYQAMEYLSQQNRVNAGQRIHAKEWISAEGKQVVVLGGGDTGADCVGTANRQSAKSVRQFELLPKPPEERAWDNPWPQWPNIYRSGTSHEEGVDQDFCVLTKYLSGDGHKLTKLHLTRLEYGEKDPATGRSPFKEIPGSEMEVECDLLILAMGFLGPVKKGMLEELDIVLDERGNIKTDKNFMTNVPGVFAAGDMHSGQSLVVRAINEGRLCAEGVHARLQK